MSMNQLNLRDLRRLIDGCSLELWSSHTCSGVVWQRPAAYSIRTVPQK